MCVGPQEVPLLYVFAPAFYWTAIGRVAPAYMQWVCVCARPNPHVQGLAGLAAVFAMLTKNGGVMPLEELFLGVSQSSTKWRWCSRMVTVLRYVFVGVRGFSLNEDWAVLCSSCRCNMADKTV